MEGKNHQYRAQTKRISRTESKPKKPSFHFPHRVAQLSIPHQYHTPTSPARRDLRGNDGPRSTHNRQRPSSGDLALFACCARRSSMGIHRS